jgi:hypothetical protein
MALKTISLFKSNSCGAQGTAGTISSDPVDLRDIKDISKLSFTYTLGGTAATCGSSNFIYDVCPVYDGTYIPAGTFGTHGATKESDIIAINSPLLSSFMRVRCVSGTSNQLSLTGELNVY